MEASLLPWVFFTLLTNIPDNLSLQSPAIHVGRGQSVYITKEHLELGSLDVLKSCKVETVLNEPVTQRVGRLTPQVFDCHFLSDEVKYVHNGSPLLEEDSVLLRVYRFTDSQTFIKTLMLRVRVLLPIDSLIQLGKVPLEVPKYYGLSNIIDRGVLTFRSQPGSVCNVRFLISETNMPSLGRLVTDDQSSQSESSSNPTEGRQTQVQCLGNQACFHGTKEVRFLKASCEEFLNSAVKYQHLSPPSSEVDYIPIRVEIRDQSSRALLEMESAWIPVLIHGAMQNQPPQAAFMSSFILEVDQFILTPVTTAALDAKDDESPQTQLVFNITKPPSEGYLTHLDEHTKPVSSFTWQDLHDMKIAYQPPNTSCSSRRTYEVEFQAIDSSFATSPPIMVHFSIRPSDTNAPRVSWNMGLDLLEGQSRPITWESFQIVDSDNLNAVFLVAVDGPLHGRLSVRGKKAFMFEVRDLQEGVVVYHHSDSDTTRDHVVFRITDGQHAIRHKFPINILPKDDTPPFLINNVGFELQEGGSVLVEEYMLLASDLDSSDDYILYQLITYPQAGEIIKRSSPQIPGIPVKSFLQRDLYQGLIYYRHLGEEVFEDSFDFTLSDNNQPPNLSQKYTVVVHISPVKDQLPKEAPGSVRSITVKETETAHITQSHLHFRDTESPDTDLMYFITQSCFSPATPGILDAGKLFYADSALSMKKDPTAAVLKSFTQHAVNYLKVGYMPPLEDIGVEPLFVQFAFSLSDQQGGVLSGLSFNITVTPVDNQPPEVFTNPIRVEEGGSAFITGEHMQVQDIDSQEAQLRVILQKSPLHGRIEKSGGQLLEGDSFTLQDLKALRVRYIHDDSETLKDSIVVTATDGTNTAPGNLSVKILPVNDEPPLLGPGLRSGLTCAEGGRVQITAEYLYATDKDSDDERLSYMLALKPAQGELQRDGLSVDKFSQQDVLQGLIFYVHTGGEVGPRPVSDSVTVIVSDGDALENCCHEDAPPPPVPLHGSLPVYNLNITLLPVNNQHPVVTIGDVFMVDEGSSACLCGGTLGATDADTTQEELLFTLEVLPRHGFIENTLPSPGFEKSNAGIQVESFSLLHLLGGHINYVQAQHQGVEPTMDQFVVSVQDGLHKSTPVPFYIVINPTNDEAPSLLLSNFTVMEGGMKELSPDIFDVVDLDVPADMLHVTVAMAPTHGFLLNGIYGLQMNRYKEMGSEILQRSLPVQSFTTQDLRQGMKILYMHDDTETLKDAFTLQLTDGKHTVQGIMQAHILPVNDEEPRLLKNVVLEVDILDKRVISSAMLETEDQDTPSHEIFYVLGAVPKFGKLQLRTEEGWADLMPGQNFTQKDVEINNLRYIHTTLVEGKGHDSFRFYLSDGASESPNHSFFILLRPVRKGGIVLTTKPVSLTEGERVILTTDLLLATDGGGRADELLYTVLLPPAHGHLHYVQHPGVALTTFSQIDVAAQQVAYTHDNSHTESRDSFSFIVSNGATSKNGTMHFAVEHGDRIPPALIRNGVLHVETGETMQITEENLELSDPDTSLANLTYTITQHPQHGKLLLRGRPLSHPSFTQADINSVGLSYQHHGGHAKSDTFAFLPSDGTNRGFILYSQLWEEPILFSIQIAHVDKTPPSLVTKKSPSTVENLQGGKQGIYITSQHLQASDPESPDQELEFSILRAPIFGHLRNAVTGAYIKGRFTQKDLNRRAVQYVIDPDIDITVDSFEFQVTDPAGNIMLSEVLELKWSRVELSATCYRVCENTGTLPVQLIRKGHSADPAYVAIQVEEESAILGRDFTHSTADLIQFDPGVNRKSWNVYLKDDGLEETHESFQIVLKQQQNAILGQRNQARVEIVDPREGRCDPKDLLLEEEQVPFPQPPSPGVVRPTAQPAPQPRGDVPNHQLLPDYTEGELKDEASPSQLRVHSGGAELKNREKIWTFHGMVPLKVEEEPQQNIHLPHQALSELQVTPVWDWPGDTDHEHNVEGVPQHDSPGAPSQRTAQKHERWYTGGPCPYGWTPHEKSCYILSPGVTTWSNAQLTCSQVFSSNLTSVHSRRHMKWLWKFAGEQPFWIGLSGTSGQMTWTDGLPVSYSKLKRSSSTARRCKNGSGSCCVLVQTQRKWITEKCAAGPDHKFICLASAEKFS